MKHFWHTLLSLSPSLLLGHHPSSGQCHTLQLCTGDAGHTIKRVLHVPGVYVHPVKGRVLSPGLNRFWRSWCGDVRRYEVPPPPLTQVANATANSGGLTEDVMKSISRTAISLPASMLPCLAQVWSTGALHDTTLTHSLTEPPLADA